MKLSLWLVGIFVHSALTLLYAGDGAGNGQGPAEKNTIYAHTRLDTTIKTCLASSSCLLTPWERALLGQIRKALPKEGPSDKLIEFRSGKKYPGFFVIDGELKIAKTGDNVGDRIYINLDLLYPKNGLGFAEPMSIAAMTAVLIHELGHHQSVKDHSKLDLLGSKVENFLHSLSQEIMGGALWRHVHVTTLDRRDVVAFTNVILTDGDAYYDLTPKIINALSCDPTTGTTKLVGARIWNVSWGGGVVLKQQFIKARVEQVCQNEEGKLVRLFGYSQLKIHPSLHVDNKGVVRVANKVEKIHVEEIVCASDPTECW